MLNNFKKVLNLVFALLLASFFIACEESIEDENWKLIKPGGETICGDGSDFYFWSHRGSTNKILVFFEGGGACWDYTTCALGTGKKSISDSSFPGSGDTWVRGVFELDNNENPFKDWNIVFVPYCTADIHWGDNIVKYASNYEVHHKGFINGMSALNWIYDNHPDPDFIFISGCSAGAYGSRMYTPHLIEHYNNTPVVMLPDSGAGVIEKDWYLEVFPIWEAYDNRPMWIPGIGDKSLEELGMTELMIASGNYYSDYIIAEYNTYNDNGQKVYLLAQGGDVANYSTLLDEYIMEVANNTSNYRYYVPSGTEHCIMCKDNFYTTEVDGVKFRDWVKSLAAGDDVPSIHCVDCE